MQPSLPVIGGRAVALSGAVIGLGLLGDTLIYAVLPLAGSELFDVISTRGALGEQASRLLFREMVSAVVYCLEHGVAHRDVSPENFLMDSTHPSRPVLIDFGLAALMTKRRHRRSGAAIRLRSQRNRDRRVSA